MSSVSTTIPVFDVRLFTSSSFLAPKREEEDALEKLRSSLDSAGCFQDTACQFLERVRKIAHHFYPLPIEEKQKYALPVNEDEGEILHEYAMKVKSLIDLVYKAMARSLNIGENSFSDHFGEQALMRADPEKEIGPVDCLVDEQRPRLYRNVKNYALIDYKWHQKGKVATETLKIS
ncbi:hypothetical protein NC653_015855 [Populus alba x Populus x berolinensis]|uniref:Uncharacterized protein n=1 Tax=Populus alba x Populus x berolinensis TaxID=444605 RepID=A0AAD6QLI0_9ROSI|nr:hypothetical protein NC653_015855 [Populus alba x Populus x berolinensis]